MLGAVFATAATPAGAVTNGLIAFETSNPAQTIQTIDLVPPMPAATTTQAGAPAAGMQAGMPAIGMQAGTRVTVRRLPKGSANPAWSADGTMLAFSSTQGGVANIYVVTADGKSDPRPITKDPVAAIDPTWSPDGTSIAFTSLRNGNPDIYVTGVAASEVDGIPPQRLTADPGYDQQADWSRDGIAFESNRAGNGDGDIWLMMSDGRNPRRLTSAPADELDPAWSPNAKQIAFSSGAPGTSTRAIYSIDVATPPGPAKALTQPAVAAGFPAWSPDGELIAFSQSGSLMVMKLKPPQTATLLAADATDPVWAPLPPPVAGTTGTVTVVPPSGGTEMPAVDGQALPTGTKVDTTAPGAMMTVAFLRPEAPKSTPTSVVQVTGAKFTIEGRTPAVLTVRIAPPDCSDAPVRAAKAKAKSKSTKTVTRASGTRKAGRPKVKNDDLDGTAERSSFVVTETCRGTTVSGVEGLVVVKERRPRGGRRGVHRLRTGQRLWVPKP